VEWAFSALGRRTADTALARTMKRTCGRFHDREMTLNGD
jgi:hypothetical protein